MHRIQRRVLIVVTALALAGIAFSGSADAGVTAISRFHQSMYGHDRTIQVSSTDVITEKFYTGCCPPVSTFELRLSHVHYNRFHQPVGRVRVIYVHYDKGAYRFPGVHRGVTGQAIIKRGIYHDSVLKATFCTPRAGGACGA